MRLSSRKLEQARKIELSMTSMIDVVFLLLIFFMTTASFVRTERDLDSAIKVNSQSTQQAPVDLEPAIVEVDRGGTGFVYRLGGRELASAGELENVLRQFGNKSQGAFVRVADAAPFGMAASAIQACKSAGFVTVSYIPLEPS
jgi:biopolymer transport protein ExbD